MIPLLIARFEAAVEATPDKLFLHFFDVASDEETRVTYAEADREASRRAHLLRGYGLQRGERIGILQPNSVEWILFYLAAQKAGLVTVALNAEALGEELSALVRESGIRLIVADAPRAAVAAGLKAQCPNLLAVLSDGGLAETQDFRPVLCGLPDRFVHDAEIDPDGCVAIIFSSGTTSARPKAVQVGNRQLVVGIGCYAEQTGISPDERLMLVTPIFHSCTLSWGISMTMLKGCTLVLTSRFSAGSFWDHARRGRASFLWTMGSIAHILMQYPVTPVEKEAAAGLRQIFAAGTGSRMPEALARWPNVRYFDAYGLTESPATLATEDCYGLPDPYPCVGRPVAAVDLRIVDLETGERCQPGQPGEIVIDLENGFLGYLGNPAAMAEAVRDGVFHTGDLAYMDSERRVFFMDRLKEIIRSGGRNISAGEVEQAMLAHPNVAEVAAVPQPDPVLGEKVAIFCVLKDPARGLDVAEARAHCDGRLPEYRRPSYVYVMSVDEIPRTPTGKLAKFRLKQMLRGEGSHAAAG